MQKKIFYFFYKSREKMEKSKVFGFHFQSIQFNLHFNVLYKLDLYTDASRKFKSIHII